MGQHYFIGFTFLLACIFLEASSRPSNNESSTSLKMEVPVEEFPEEFQERSLPIEERQTEIGDEVTKDILDKIKAINDRLKKPHRQQINYNSSPYTGGGYVLDKAILEKIQQIIASGKLHGTQKEQENNSINNEETVEDADSREVHSRALQYVQPTLANNALSSPTVGLPPLPYLTSIPVLVLPVPNGANGYPSTNDLNTLQSMAEYSTRQGPGSLPFQIQSPFAPFFPVLLKDPLLHYLSGGRWENWIEYGQSADVCNRKQKSTNTGFADDDIVSENDNLPIEDGELSLNPVNVINSREGRKLKNIKKRTVSKSTPLQTFNDVKHIQNLFAQKPQNTKPITPLKPVKKVEAYQDTKTTNGDEGDLRFPFSDFTWFGNRKPVAPSPGFFINRLKVRRGGVAIAGPGGVATAGKGGTALVGPGGLAYTQPGGLAVAGPAARVVALSSDTDLNAIIHRLQQQAATDGSVPRLLQAIPEGKVVATGPVIYYHPYTD